MSQNVVIPEGAVLCFVDSGRIENGTLIGNGTKVMAQQNVVFSDNILLKGSWKADTAYSIWFDFKSDCEYVVFCGSLYVVAFSICVVATGKILYYLSCI